MRQEFDHVIIDCPPSFAFQVKFFLSVADTFIVPCVPDRLSVNGSKYLMDRIQTCRFRLKGLGVLWTLYRDGNHLHRRRVEAARNGTGPDMETLPPPFETVIPNAAGIAEATELVHSKPATFSRKYAEFAPLFKKLTAEIVERAELQQAEDAEVGSEPVLVEV
jgi:chromosome partitioning protein